MFYVFIQEVKARGTSQRKPKACTDVQMLPNKAGVLASVSPRFIHLLCMGVSPTQNGYFRLLFLRSSISSFWKKKKGKTSVSF